MSAQKITRSLSLEAIGLLAELAAADARGRRPNESATLETLIREEAERRRRRRERGETPKPPSAAMT